MTLITSSTSYAGSIVNTDHLNKVTYATIHPEPTPRGPSVAQHQLREGRIIVDVDDVGRIIGVEVMDDNLHLSDLLLVLRECKWAGVYTAFQVIGNGMKLELEQENEQLAQLLDISLRILDSFKDLVDIFAQYVAVSPGAS